MTNADYKELIEAVNTAQKKWLSPDELQEEYGILKSINEVELFDSSIPIMIELSERLNENISTFSSFLDGKNFDNISSNSAYEISKYLMRNLEFEKSLKFAELSIQKCNENYRLPILKSHRNKINSFCNFGY